MNICATATGVYIEHNGGAVTVPLSDVPDMIETLRRAVVSMPQSAFLEERARLIRDAPQS